jgi:CheY-like chemotaxis protein
VTHTLLLADDSITIQKVIELTFANEDVHVIAVGDGDQAIAFLNETAPDIVLADVGMPGRDGYEVVRHLRSTPRLSHIPALLLTGAFEPVDPARAKDVGSQGVLTKPFEPQLVIQKVRELLSGRAQVTAAPPFAVTAAEPAAQSGPVGQVGPASDLPAFEGGSQPGPVKRDEVERYFEELDRAFANLPPPSQRRAAEDDPPAAAPERPPQPSLAATFGALLEAERSGADPAAAIGLPELAVALPDPVIEEIVQRVLERMSDRVVRDTVTRIVLDTAERLVREEIQRVKDNVR